MLKEFARTKELGDVFSRRDIRLWFASAYPMVRVQTIDRQTTALTTNIPSRVYWNPSPSDDIFFRLRPDAGDLRLYDPRTDPPPIRSAEATPTEGDDEGGDDIVDGEAVSSAQFALESHLRDFLAKDITRIEPGLRLFDEIEDVDGVEVPMGGGRSADLVVLDAKNNILVIELKVNRGVYAVIGQLLRYIGYTSKHYAKGRTVRGMVIAADISDDLRIACEPLLDAGMDVSLKRYVLDFSIVSA
jgi:hypothetical protein